MDSRLKTFFRIAPCLLAIIVDYAGFGLVYPLVSVMFTETNVEIFPYIKSVASSDFYMSLAYLFYPLGMFFGASFLGDLSDSYGRKKILELAMAGIFFSFILMGIGVFFHYLSIFLIGRLCSGLMAGSQPLSQAAIADVSRVGDKAKNMTLVILTNCIGVIIGPLIAGLFSTQLFIKEMGFTLPFFIAAFIALCAFLWIFFGFKETYIPSEKRPVHWARPILIFFDAFREPKIRILSFVVLFFQLGLAIYYQFIAVYLIREFSYSSTSAGFFYGYMGVLFGVGGLWFFPYALKRYSLNKVVVWGIFVNGVMEIITGLTANEVLVWIWTIPLALFNVIGYTGLITVFSNCADETKQGWVMGIFAAMVSFAFMFAGLFANVLPWLKSNEIILIGGIFIILGSLIMLFYESRYPIEPAK